LLSLSAISALTQGDLDLDYDLVVQFTPGTVTDYCPGAINSLGVACPLEVLGAPSIGAAQFSFFARNVHPMTPAQIFCGTTQAHVPFGDGLRCAGGSVRRLNVHAASATGTWVWSPSHATLLALPFLAPGSVWNFQVLYRDMNGPLNTGFNLSSAVNITVLP
jgi:hypothetical protein